MKRMNRMVLVLVAVFVLGGSLALLGCDGGDDDNQTPTINANSDNAALLGGKTFLFPDGTPFGVTPPGTPTRLEFNGSSTITPTRFRLTAGGSVATGNVTFKSIDLVVTSSTNSGTTIKVPAVGTTFSFDAQFDTALSRLIITVGGTIFTGTSTAPTGTGSF